MIQKYELQVSLRPTCYKFTTPIFNLNAFISFGDVTRLQKDGQMCSYMLSLCVLYAKKTQKSHGSNRSPAIEPANSHFTELSHLLMILLKN
jgi:hypothetical protein